MLVKENIFNYKLQGFTPASDIFEVLYPHRGHAHINILTSYYIQMIVLSSSSINPEKFENAECV